MITVVDYSIGNLGAISNMYKRLGIDCEITGDLKKIENAQRLILPGNGSFDACMQSLRMAGLIPLLNEKVLVQKVPILGICVGAQMLGHSSEEGMEKGLGWINMVSKRFPSSDVCRVPHMGWGRVNICSSSSVITEAMSKDARFYFVHSYYFSPKNSADVLMTSMHGIEFPAAIGFDNIYGVQFHPEKSHKFGKTLLLQFAGGNK